MSDIRLGGTTLYEMSSPQLRHRRAAEFFRGNGLPKNLLDIGCGNGTVTKGLREVLHLDIVDGVDILADRVQIPEWLRIVKLDVDKELLPYSNNHFDAIYCGELLEHLYNPDSLLDEIYRVLSIEGICLITTPNLASWFNRLILLVGYQPSCISSSFHNEDVGKLSFAKVIGQRGHIRAFTLRSLLELLRIHRLRPIKVMGWNVGQMHEHFDSGILSRAVDVVDRIMSRVPSLATRLAVGVKKEVSTDETVSLYT